MSVRSVAVNRGIALDDKLLSLIRGATAIGKAIAFWVACLSPLVTIPVVFTGAQLSTFLLLILGQILALYCGRSTYTDT